VAVFVAAVLIAGASAGMAFAPFVDAARSVAPAERGRVRRYGSNPRRVAAT
jgi:hypothetical protein